MGEFDLITRYFKRPAVRSPLGVGDDCALLAPAPGMQLAVSCDMLVEGRHFLSTVDPVRLGHKALAVNLSDLAACGAKPLAFTLALALPGVDEPWLEGFGRQRDRAAKGFESARARMEQPTPRVALGLALRGIASSAVDVSDGLIGDLGHILASSGVGATLDADAATALIAVEAPSLSTEILRTCALSGGDDYELVFTAAPSARAAVEQAGEDSATCVTRIGRIEADAGLRIVDAAGAPVSQRFGSFDHFV
ncbi:AIR synthase related protein [Variovorax sp. Varisp62]|uniref:AIR synthase related protein n=1 Tax=Variovorax sp. Varisp62 TaxID=3243049 RepID=UPI0039B50386